MNRHTVALLGMFAIASSAVSCGGAGGDLFGSGGSGGAGTTGHGATTGSSTGGTSSSGLRPGPGCSASSQTISKPPPSEQHVTVCQPSASCNGGACLTAAEQGGMCITHPGTVPCPAGFPTATFVSLGVADARTCSGCSCGSTLGCQLTGLLVDNDSACGTANLYNFTAVPGACTVAPSSYPFNAAEARATVTGSDTCATTAPSSPTGDVTLDPQSAATVCCP